MAYLCGTVGALVVTNRQPPWGRPVALRQRRVATESQMQNTQQTFAVVTVEMGLAELSEAAPTLTIPPDVEVALYESVPTAWEGHLARLKLRDSLAGDRLFRRFFDAAR